MQALSSAVSLSIALAASVGGQTVAGNRPAMPSYQAQAKVVSGDVSRVRDGEPWAVSAGEGVPLQDVITTGADGYARFEVPGGSSFELFGNSRVVFRQNPANAGDLVDVLAGRVRIHLQPAAGMQQLRVFCPVAILSTHQTTTIALGVDEDETTRIDVMEGEVRVQHTLLPRNEPVLVKAVDAILVQKDQPISHRVERGSLYRHTMRILLSLTPGHASSRNADPIEQGKFLAEALLVRSQLDRR